MQSAVSKSDHFCIEISTEISEIETESVIFIFVANTLNIYAIWYLFKLVTKEVIQKNDEQK